VNVKHLVHDLPVPIDFEQREWVGVVRASPVIEFEAYGRDGAGDFDVYDIGFEIRGPCNDIRLRPQVLKKRGVVTRVTRSKRGYEFHSTPCEAFVIIVDL
jgi:hypothetical protein